MLYHYLHTRSHCGPSLEVTHYCAVHSHSHFHFLFPTIDMQSSVFRIQEVVDYEPDHAVLYTVNDASVLL